MKKIKKAFLLLAMMTIVACIGGIAVACNKDTGFKTDTEYLLNNISLQGDWTKEEKEEQLLYFENNVSETSKLKFDGFGVYMSELQDDGTWSDFEFNTTYTLNNDTINTGYSDVWIVKGRTIQMQYPESYGKAITWIFERK